MAYPLVMIILAHTTLNSSTSLFTTQLLVINILAMYSIKPQLDYIYRTLQKVAIDNLHNTSHNKIQNIRVCQHFSPACRASRSKVALDLASAQILSSLDDADVEVNVHVTIIMTYF